MFTFHVVSLPHTQSTRMYSNCAFTDLLRKFCDMMTSLGHRVVLYASEDNDAACDELVTCITKKEQADLIGVTGPENILRVRYEENLPYWQLFHQRVIEGLRARVEQRDFICLASGWCQRTIAEAFPQITVEPWVGYMGTAHERTHQVFPSHTWQHMVYGRWYGQDSGFQGRFYDRVIPHYYEVENFPYVEDKDDYFCFIGRLNPDKGVGIADLVAKELGVRLVVAGQGAALPTGDHIDYRGLVGPEERAEILSHARASFAPTLYCEPFGLVVPEAQLCGTPSITTDWGAFPETVEHGVSGFRCHNLAEFIHAARIAGDLDPADCRAKGLQYDQETIKYDYEHYFQDLSQLWGEGWYTK